MTCPRCKGWGVMDAYNRVGPCPECRPFSAELNKAYPLPQQPDECMDAYLKRLGK